MHNEASQPDLRRWWHRLCRELDLPFPAWLDDADGEIFVLVQQVLEPTAEDLTVGDLLCDVRQENRPMLVRLSRLRVEPGSESDTLLREYQRR